MAQAGEDIVWRVGGRLVKLRPPLVMGILNVTPDSFVASSRRQDHAGLLEAASEMLGQGAHVLDVGGASSRPGAKAVSVEEELQRVVPAVELLHRHFPEALLSIDTWRADVAKEAVAAGASLVNDISAGQFDEAMLETVAGLHVPYILMHMQGTPENMQHAPHYHDVVAEVAAFLSARAALAHGAGIADLVIDPGFGFGKDLGHNFSLLRGLPALAQLGLPVLAGLSRKRMVNQVLGTVPADALNGTTVVNTLALLGGAAILRVHDVREAVQAVKLVQAYGLEEHTGQR